MKRMLEVKDGVFYVNSSSVDLIQSCRRKAYYALERGLRGGDESEAQLFGTAIHKAMEAFYGAPIEGGVRRLTLEQFQDAFAQAASQLEHLPDADKRSIANGKKILEKYWSIYQNDPWQVVHDRQGPVVERKFELDLTPSIVLHGQIDCLLQNVETGEIVVCDHKTSSSLGSDFLNRIKPNLQFSIYAWAARQLGFPVSRVMVNGIQVAKTKVDLLRVFTDRKDSDFEEMWETIMESVELYRGSQKRGIWPINSSSCSSWGGCQYRDICSLDAPFRETAIEQIYGGK
jgi:hypothetical protein